MIAPCFFIFQKTKTRFIHCFFLRQLFFATPPKIKKLIATPFFATPKKFSKVIASPTFSPPPFLPSAFLAISLFLQALILPEPKLLRHPRFRHPQFFSKCYRHPHFRQKMGGGVKKKQWFHTMKNLFLHEPQGPHWGPV